MLRNLQHSSMSRVDQKWGGGGGLLGIVGTLTTKLKGHQSRVYRV